MPASLLLTISASVMTIVADWAGWHFVWRHENNLSGQEPNKHNAVSVFISYYLPLNADFSSDSWPIKIRGLQSRICYSFYNHFVCSHGYCNRRGSSKCLVSRAERDYTKDARELIDAENSLPSHALEHLKWTTIMLALCSAFWIFLLIR